MRFTETNLPGAYLVDLTLIEDERGFFARGWCTDEFARHGLVAAMTQLNVGFSHRRGSLRGMHYQEHPHQEAKFVRCTRGAIF
ncbi:MAG TPA: dTDP-4-dehydrorhamnose 3,5-epimerase family protein, partial [Mycobacterium sp.]|nr:dTDP-4-dehydrorhamnose 3,5-epimerase family protein [Mycobacterium sp.]